MYRQTKPCVLCKYLEVRAAAANALMTGCLPVFVMNQCRKSFSGNKKPDLFNPIIGLFSLDLVLQLISFVKKS